MAIPVLRARKQLADMEVQDYVHSKKNARREVAEKVSKRAYPISSSEPLPMEAIKDLFGGMNG